MSIKQKTFSAVRWTSLAMFGNTVLQIAQLMILARLLSPDDFGLMAIVYAIIAFVHVFSDLGVSNAIIHHDDVSREQLSTLYWLNVMVGFALMVMLMLLSQPLADYVFNLAMLQSVLLFISLSVFVTALGQQYRVVAEKQLRFRVVAKIEMIAGVLSFAMAVGWALVSPDVYALVIAHVVNELAKTVLLWLNAPGDAHPQWCFRPKEIKSFMKFGGYVMATNFVNSVNLQADVLIAGRLFPASALGLYSLPRTLSLRIARVINPIVTRVGLPVMAKFQKDTEKLSRIYLKTTRMTASVNMPIYLGLAFFSVETVDVAFGERWSDAAPLLALLSLWAMIRSSGNPVGSLLLAVGRADLSFKWNLGVMLLVPPVLWVSSRWGIQGMAIAQVLLMTILVIPSWYFLIRPACGAPLSEYFQSLLAPFLCSLIAVSLAGLMTQWIEISWLKLLIAALIAIPSYLVASYLLNREWVATVWELLLNKRM